VVHTVVHKSFCFVFASALAMHGLEAYSQCTAWLGGFAMQVVHWLYARLGLEALKLGGKNTSGALALAMLVGYACRVCL